MLSAQQRCAAPAAECTQRSSSRPMLRRVARRALPASFGATPSPFLTRAASAEAPASAPQDGASAKPPRRKRVLSGVQPTGNMHLGNYFGAVRNWVDLTEEYDALFCVVDMHAITVPHDPKELRDSVRTTAGLYIASGIDPEKSSIFVQSHVSAHAELAWILNCTTPIGWVERMIQFKEKARRQGQDVSLGLLSYPVLMAADILLYQADLVPVGEDQKQHLELARDIAERFNHLYGGKKWKKLGGRGGRVFTVPEPLIPPEGARIMSLQDGTSKMSKSAENEKSRINLLDPPDVITKKIKSAKTDLIDGCEFDNPERPESTNLLTLYALATGKSREEVLAECGAMRWGQFKPTLADALVAHLEPIQKKYAEVREDPAYLDEVLRRGEEAANETASRTMYNAYQAMGFEPRRRT